MIRVDQTLLNKTMPVENIRDIYISLNEFITKIDLTIYLMILIMYHKY